MGPIKITSLRVGDTLRVTSNYSPCLRKGARLKVRRDKRKRLYVRCPFGDRVHTLDYQTKADGTLRSLERVKRKGA